MEGNGRENERMGGHNFHRVSRAYVVMAVPKQPFQAVWISMTKNCRSWKKTSLTLKWVFYQRCD